MKFDIKNRFSGEVIFSTELSAEIAGKEYSFQLGFAVKKAVEARADLSRANLSGADLSRADLSRANLSDANLSRANLSRADLSDAVERSFKADLWMTLTQNAHEVPALVSALREGRVDGSVYEGECACLVGTIANARGVSHEDLDHSASNPAERWFMMIRKGDKPDDETGGGFASKMALQWTLEFCAATGIEIAEAQPA